MSPWNRLWRSEEGATLSEYSLTVVLIAMAAVASVQLFGLAVARLWDHIVTEWP